MGFVLSVVNNKGGCGKTTTACNLAEALGRRGKQVLVVDLDNQCNSTTLLAPRGLGMRHTLYEILERRLRSLREGTEVDDNLEDYVYVSEASGVRMVPNVEETSALEPDMIRLFPESAYCLRDLLREFAAKRFDYTVVDCPPNLGTFVLAALFSSDFVIVPVWAWSSFAIEGLNRALKLIESVKEKDNTDLRLLKLVITAVDKRMSVSRSNIQSLRATLPADKIFTTEIPFNKGFHAAEQKAQTIFQHDGTSSGARAYRKLAEELVDTLEPRARQQSLID
jgi:cellulose biosynthesis protein BcsQ